MITQGDIFPPGLRDGRVRVSGDTPVFPGMNHPEAGVPLRGPVQRRRGFFPVAAPVVQNGLPPLITLGQQAVQQFPQISFLRVVHRDHHADQPRRRRVFPLPGQILRGSLFLSPLAVPGAQNDLPRLFPAAADRVSDPVSLRVFPESLQSVHFRFLLKTFFGTR